MAKTYKFTQIADVRRKFNDTFNVPMTKFYDSLMSAVVGHVVIDIVSFDQWLSNKSGYNEDKNLMENVLTLYGQEAHDLIDTLTNMDD